MRTHAVMCRSMACTRRVGAAANVATGLYAWVDLKDWTLAGANAADGLKRTQILRALRTLVPLYW